ncbi:hypothetical protein HanRHA438_Chr05g0226841 [Helianthus annuus]|nr:hypothetical protein HanRHA438_Chr05g0226841 [Helianthus annuus]
MSEERILLPETVSQHLSCSSKTQYQKKKEKKPSFIDQTLSIEGSDDSSTTGSSLNSLLAPWYDSSEKVI